MSKLVFWSITSALAGFLFGFDTVVISGAEERIESLWNLSPLLHGLAISGALWGTVAGSLVGGFPTDLLGRRKTLIWIGALYLLSSVWSALAGGVVPFIIARFLGGLGIGISTVASPLFISEIAPPSMRGRLAGMFQFNIVFGILAAFLSNYLIGRHMGEHAWRWMLGVMAVPSLVYTVCCLFLPESPRWLIGRLRDRAAGIDVLRKLNPTQTQAEIEALADSIETSATREEKVHGFWSASLRTPIALAFLIAFFNQLSGINAILYFAPRIFKMAGLGDQAALLESVGIGVTNLIFTFAGLWLIDRLGRRTLLFIGSFGYILSLGLCSWAFFTGHFRIVPACVFAFIAAHAVGQGAVIWVFIAEIFPNRFRAMGQSLGSATHWVFAAGLTLVFRSMVEMVPAGVIFLFFTVMMVLQLLWVTFMMPETKGVALESLETTLTH